MTKSLVLLSDKITCTVGFITCFLRVLLACLGCRAQSSTAGTRWNSQNQLTKPNVYVISLLRSAHSSLKQAGGSMTQAPAKPDCGRGLTWSHRQRRGKSAPHPPTSSSRRWCPLFGRHPGRLVPPISKRILIDQE